MAIEIYFRRFVALLLCCVLVGSSFARSAYASDPVTAASLAITGGQLAAAGLSGEAALSLAGPVGAVVGVTLGALGVNAYVSKAAQEAGKTRTRFVLDKLVIWGAQAGYTQEQLYSKIAQGISVAANGTIQLANDTTKIIEQFGNWLFTQPNTVYPSLPSVSQKSISIGDIEYPCGNFTTYVTSGDLHDVDITYSMPDTTGAVFCNTGVNGSILLFSRTSFQATVSSVAEADDSYFNETRTSTKYQRYDLYYVVLPRVGFTADAVFDNMGYYTGSYGDFLWSIKDASWTYNDVVQEADDCFTGTSQDWVENKDVLNPSAEDTPIVLNPDLLNPIIDSLADGQQATMSIIDYLQALQDAWDHALDDVQTAIGTITDSLTGIQEQIAVPQEAVANPTITNPSVIPETTPVLDPSAVDPGTAVTGLSFDLTQIFPFCIPFDIYAMLSTLSATPEAPVYHVHYEGPYNIVIDFTVDLSPWNSVASVLRTVELLAFCIGLAYVTRSMFIRS